MSSSRARFVRAAAIVAATLSAPVVAQDVTWRTVVVNPKSNFEAAGVADFDRDGDLDLVCGDTWYEGPTWKPHRIGDIPEIGGYRLDFANVPLDVDGDGQVDVVSCNWHGQSVVWRRNPGADGGDWEQQRVGRPGNCETALAVDVDGDGRLDFLPDVAQRTIYYRVEDGGLVGHEIAGEGHGHGIGFGDVNGDGRGDVLRSDGWFEAPVDRSSDAWVFHPDWQLGAAGIGILAHDFDGDGLTDLFWGHGHDYGLYWLEQSSDADGRRAWTRHTVDESWSQAHALRLVDLDGDGVSEVLTGKRRYAHNGNDPGAEEEAVVLTYAFDRATRRFVATPLHDGDGDGLGLAPAVADLDADGDLDVVAPGKGGLFVYLQERRDVERASDDGRGPPADFPRFEVPGFAGEMDRLRALFWAHYAGAGPKATLWDQWLPGPALWPAVAADGWNARMRASWRSALSSRSIDADGYVATHQHASIAHQRGWPFPFWNQGRGVGWHWSFDGTVGPPWRKETLDTDAGWTLEGCTSAGLVADGWRVAIDASTARLISPPIALDAFEAPFLQLRWRGRELADARIQLRWLPVGEDEWSTTNRVACPSPGAAMRYDMLATGGASTWRGRIGRVALQIEAAPERDAELVLQALFSQYDTRHNVNSQAFVHGCAQYFWWTGDVPFLRDNVVRMRRALRHLLEAHRIDEHVVIGTAWTGHDGRSGIVRNGDRKQLRYGHGIGNNYWDLLPFGHLDLYATSVYYAALRTMAAIEDDVRGHPEWEIDEDLAFDPDALRDLAERVAAEANELFWNESTGRFVACVDADGARHDYGFTFVNLEAVHYGLARADHARSVLDWITGERIVDGDTAVGAGIYDWRFAPRATTRRNVDWYGWYWTAPESIPWGGQVQDGGAVLGFSYHDLMARLRVRGPDDAWRRLQEILAWYGEVQAAGGYRAYYADGSRGRLQGGGVAGGLGMDHEFFESVLVPQVVLDGFLGFRAGADGISLAPALPTSWPSLRVTGIRWHDLVLDIEVTAEQVVLRRTPVSRPMRVELAGVTHEWASGTALTLAR